MYMKQRLETHLDLHRSACQIIEQHRARQTFLDARTLLDELIDRALGDFQTLGSRDLDDFAHDRTGQVEGVGRRIEESIGPELGCGRHSVPLKESKNSVRHAPEDRLARSKVFR